MTASATTTIRTESVSIKDNLLAAIVVVLLLAAAASVTDELAEDSQSCYWPDGGCGAWGVPATEVSFHDVFQDRIDRASRGSDCIFFRSGSSVGIRRLPEFIGLRRTRPVVPPLMSSRLLGSVPISD
jgi:hypothetical protein